MRYRRHIQARHAPPIMPTQALRSRAGFSLVEMIAAVTIFSIGVLSVMTIFTACLKSTSASRGHTWAVQLAQQVVEETLAKGEIIEGAESGVFGAAFPVHSWTSAIVETSQEGLYDLEVTVTWQDRGREKHFTLATLVAKRSPD